MLSIPEIVYILLETLMDSQSMNMICQHMAKILLQSLQTVSDMHRVNVNIKITWNSSLPFIDQIFRVLSMPQLAKQLISLGWKSCRQ
jgi:hypothetical protein